LKEGLDRLEEQFANQANEKSNEVLNLQKVEKTLAKQKKYVEAQKMREDWLRL
jgi:hypothetical protein